jgi:hypothetical protein
MRKISFALCAIIPLAWGTMALAADPSGQDMGSARPTAEHRHGDMAAWHKEMCTDRYAHEASRLAYIQAKLSLSEPQSALFAKWRQAVLDQGTKERAACLDLTPKGDSKPTFLEREAHMEKVLALKLQGLQATRPALEALYNSLSDEQKTIFDHASRHHGHHFGGMMGHSGGMTGHMGMGQDK